MWILVVLNCLLAWSTAHPAPILVNEGKTGSASNNTRYRWSPRLLTLPQAGTISSSMCGMQSAVYSPNGSDLESRFPPDYDPKAGYTYHIPISPLTLKCGFEYQPGHNSTQTITLFTALWKRYGDPRMIDDVVYEGHTKMRWAEGWPGHGDTSLQLQVKPATLFDSHAFRYLRFVQSITGLNNLRLSYPMLDMYCIVMDELLGNLASLHYEWNEWYSG